MRLTALLHDLVSLDPALDRLLTGMVQHSDRVKPGFVFLATQGQSFDGKRYISQAIEKGAGVVIAETENWEPVRMEAGVPIIAIPKLSMHLAELSGRFFGFPDPQLKTVGITGTNGKTSCSHFLAQALAYLNHRCGIIGTLGRGFLADLHYTQMTTPDTAYLHEIFADFSAAKATHVAMEVSSHSLDQDRIAGLPFAAGIFTNLTQDHLDYHGTMAAYGAAKKRFFTDYPMGKAIINQDDAFGATLIAELAAGKALAYSLVDSKAPIYADHLNFSVSGFTAQVHTPWGSGLLRSPLIGIFNLQNLLAVLGAMLVMDIDLVSALAALGQVTPVAGRMELLGGKDKPTLVVDYSHTPDSLQQALQALRKHCSGKLYCLFGCGGNRDRAKRPIMAAIAERYADVVMVTSDNPRLEIPEAIIDEIFVGFKDPHKIGRQVDRGQAIAELLQKAQAGDYILIAGRGAEPTQQIGEQHLPFCDKAKILELL
jgi:UDP-N-acetylmuramoyl-L-alanyl-D-glutamate--2,6-diaminopimelate ligase